MLDTLTGKLTEITRQLSGKSSISEKNIEEAVDQIKSALLDADVNIRVVRRFINRTIEEAKGEKVLKSGQSRAAVYQDCLRSNGSVSWG